MDRREGEPLIMVSSLLRRTMARFRSPVASMVPEPSSIDLATAAEIVDAQPWSLPNLVFLRDKAILFDDTRRAFVMYGRQARTWVALGDPVGPRDRMKALIGAFLDTCDEAGGVPVFYQVREDDLHVYADFGLTAVKLGEEARVDLSAFELVGGRWAKQRQRLRRLERQGVLFRVIPRDETWMVMDRLHDISDEWLERKAGGEKHFSLGSFRPDYLSRFDVAVMEHDREIIAFANVWTSAQRFEVATDLIRHCRSVPPETMEVLLLRALDWGNTQGYRWFSLGLAPLAGIEYSSTAPIWTRAGTFLYAHGEALYRFRGLRAFKEKFDPIWVPRYLVYPGRAALPRIGADVAALIAGGYRKVLLK